MARQFTEAEQTAVSQVDKELYERGVDMYDRKNGDHNAQVLLEFFDSNPTVPASLPQFHGVVTALRDRLVWRSPVWKEYDRISRENPSKALAVVRWLQGGAKTQGTPQPLVSDVENAVALLKELLTWYGSRDYAVTNDVMWQAIYRIQSRGMVVLNFASDRKTDTTGHKMGVMFEGKPNRSFVEAMKQSRPPESKPTGPTPQQAAEAEAETQARAIARDGSHAAQYELSTVLNRERNRGASWQETLTVMEKVQRDRHQSRNRADVA